jgi:hypothetical protein
MTSATHEPVVFVGDICSIFPVLSRSTDHVDP